MVPENTTLLEKIASPVTYKLLAMPTPPATYNALFCTVDVLDAVLNIVALLPTFNVLPMPAPPTIVTAPVTVESLSVALLKKNVLVVVVVRP